MDWHSLYYKIVPKVLRNYGPSFGYNWAYYLIRPHKFVYHAWLECKWFWQRGRRGYSDQDVWNLYSYIARVMDGALTHLAKKKMGHPIGTTASKWNRKLLTMAAGFHAVKEAEESFRMKPITACIKFEKKKARQTKRAIKTMSEVFFSLWD